jgi:DNA-3-methyladenine glycosylase I
VPDSQRSPSPLHEPSRACWWSLSAPELVAYHDTEWGFPVTDDRRLFEKICLEGFQAGLSWLTILKRRGGFRKAFADFDFLAVAAFGEKDVLRLVEDPGIIRHRGKIESTINNAGKAIELIEEFGSLSSYVWKFEPPASTRPEVLTEEALRKLTTCDEAKRLSKDLKKRGFSFVGPTTMYAFMQGVGLVNDHVDTCPTRLAVEAARKALVLPK